MILFDLDDIPNSQILPFPRDESNSTQKLHLTLILLFVALPPLQILNEILDHGDQHQHKKWHEDGGLAS